MRKMGLIEGKMPGIYLSSSVATMIDEKEQYIKNRGFDDEYYKELIVSYIKQFGKGKKQNIRKLLLEKLPDALDEKQKENKISNLLAGLKRENVITSDSNNQQKSNWILKE